MIACRRNCVSLFALTPHHVELIDAPTKKCNNITTNEMAPSYSSPSSSKSPSLPPPPSRLSPLFAAIQEQEEDEYRVDRSRSRATQSVDKNLTPKHHPPTPLPQTDKIRKSNRKKRSESVWSVVDGEDGSVSCYQCRPHSREKITVVPWDNDGPNKRSPLLASPNEIFKSIFFSLTRKSPRSTEAMSTSREEQWKIALAELSHKFIQATRKREEAISESSRLKYSMAELEKKLDKLEVYCHKLKSGLDECINNSPYRMAKTQNFHENDVLEHFKVAVSEARSSVRLLSRSLIMQLRHMGGKVHERVSLLLQPYDSKISFSNNSRSLLFYLEALLNKAFYEDFETVRFQKSASSFILNPEERCEVNFASFNMLHGLTWEEVLNKGTRHYSEEFSRFCDRKMSEIVAMLAWNRAWPEPLLQAFFGASKSVWLVHLLANSVHPSLSILRVDKGMRFDSVYMEDMSGGDNKGTKLVPSMVRIMISPGFYVSGGAVKCKVLCRNFNGNGQNF